MFYRELGSKQSNSRRNTRQRRGFCLDFGSKTAIFQAECQAAPGVLPGVLTKHRSAGGFAGSFNKTQKHAVLQ